MKPVFFSVLVFFNCYTFGQPYFSESHARQAREWQATERHYQGMASSNSNGYKFSGTTGSIGSSDACNNPLIQMFFPKVYKRCMAERNRASTTIIKDQTESNAAEQSRKAEASRLYAIEQKRLAGIRERKRKEEEEALMKRRVDWYYKAKDNLLLPCEEPPVSFKDNCEEYYWYAQRSLNGGGFFKTDPYSSLRAAQMQWDGKACMGQKNMNDIILHLKNAAHSSLKYCLGAEMMMSYEAAIAKKYIPNIFAALHNATQLPDITNGHERAFKHLYRLYKQDTIYGQKIPASQGQKAVVYAWAASNNDEGASKLLLSVLASNVVEIYNMDTNHLKQIIPVLSKLKKDDYMLTCIYALGLAKLKTNEQSAFNLFKKILDYPNAQKGLQQIMQANMYAIATKNEIIASQLTIEEYKKAQINTSDFVADLENAIRNNYRIKSTDLNILYNWYNGSLGEKPDIDKALKYAEMLAYEGEFEPIKKAILALRTGKAGWPKNDDKALQMIKVIDDAMPAKTNEEKEAKGTYLFETAVLFLENKTAVLKLNLSVYDELLNRAARAYTPYAYTYAKWLSDSKTASTKKSIIMAKFWGNTYAEYLSETFADRYLENAIDPQVYIDAYKNELKSVKAWVASLK